MAAVLNGLALHGGFIPYGGTFLVFSDYARNALRMAALMRVRSILVFTHDSIGLGEDGPTHQPIEHLSSLRAMPNMTVWRPCDAVETAVAWRSAVERLDGPTSLILTRQGLGHVTRTADQIELISRGGYILVDSDGEPELILMATGSEVGLVLAAGRESHGEWRANTDRIHTLYRDLRHAVARIPVPRAAGQRCRQAGGGSRRQGLLVALHRRPRRCAGHGAFR